MRFTDQRWIEPDLVVLRQSVKHVTWVPIERVLMPVEFVSPSSRHNDRIDKPRLCAEVGIPYFLRVEVSYDDVHLELLRLDNGKYRMQADAFGGQKFSTDLPFPISFDPAVLLEPESD